MDFHLSWRGQGARSEHSSKPPMQSGKKSFPSKAVTIRAGLMRFGNVDEISAGLTYYMKTLNPAGVNANPDGMLRSLIASLDWRWDREVEKNYLDLNLRFPFNARYTFGADVITDLGGFTRYGVSLKGYIKGF